MYHSLHKFTRMYPVTSTRILGIREIWSNMWRNLTVEAISKPVKHCIMFKLWVVLSSQVQEWRLLLGTCRWSQIFSIMFCDSIVLWLLHGFPQAVRFLYLPHPPSLHLSQNYFCCPSHNWLSSLTAFWCIMFFLVFFWHRQSGWTWLGIESCLK